MMRQMQILDTDYSNYMLVYSCQENVEYTDKSGTVDVMPEDVFSAYVNKPNRKDGENGLYDPKNFENLKGINQSWIHKQKVQIYTRPVYNKEINTYDFKMFENTKIHALLDDVVKKYLPNDFSEADFDNYYSKMQHDNDCDYNPYDNLAYYNLHHDDPEVKKQMLNHIENKAREEQRKLAQEHDEL